MSKIGRSLRNREISHVCEVSMLAKSEVQNLYLHAVWYDMVLQFIPYCITNENRLIKVKPWDVGGYSVCPFSPEIGVMLKYGCLKIQELSVF